MTRAIVFLVTFVVGLLASCTSLNYRPGISGDEGRATRCARAGLMAKRYPDGRVTCVAK